MRPLLYLAAILAAVGVALLQSEYAAWGAGFLIAGGACALVYTALAGRRVPESPDRSAELGRS